MSNTDMIIPERAADIGDFMVGRLLPFRRKRMVGPFIFIDHMGPMTLQGGKTLDVDQHPHTGLSTLTYLLEGEMMHADSIGSVQRIRPGSVNWMVAGSGVTHTERTPEDLRDGRPLHMHGYQIWVALPAELEDCDPEFHHVAADDLPQWTEGAASFRLVAGQGYGRVSPVPVHSDLFMVEIETSEAYDLDTGSNLFGEIGIVVVKGKIRACEHEVEAGNMLVSKIGDSCQVHLEAGTHLLLFGGEPFPEERYIRWNFVATSKEKLDAAVQRWKNVEFPQVPGDETYVPYPGS